VDKEKGQEDKEKKNEVGRKCEVEGKEINTKLEKDDRLMRIG
jgi:hypothetical protein